MAWTAPVVAVATAAPAFAASRCTPVISLDADQSCRCTGNSTPGQEFTYFLKFCVASTCPIPTGGSNTFDIVSVKTNGAGKVLTFNPDNCFPAGGTPDDPSDPGTTTGTLNDCSTNPVLRFNSESSGIKLDVTFTVNGETFMQEVISPNDCGTIQAIASRCEGCAQGDTVSPIVTP